MASNLGMELSTGKLGLPYRMTLGYQGGAFQDNYAEDLSALIT